MPRTIVTDLLPGIVPMGVIGSVIFLIIVRLFGAMFGFNYVENMDVLRIMPSDLCFKTRQISYA